MRKYPPGTCQLAWPWVIFWSLPPLFVCTVLTITFCWRLFTVPDVTDNAEKEKELSWAGSLEDPRGSFVLLCERSPDFAKNPRNVAQRIFGSWSQCHKLSTYIENVRFWRGDVRSEFSSPVELSSCCEYCLIDRRDYPRCSLPYFRELECESFLLFFFYSWIRFFFVLNIYFRIKRKRKVSEEKILKLCKRVVF